MCLYVKLLRFEYEITDTFHLIGNNMVFKIFVAVMAFTLLSPAVGATAETTNAKELKPVAVADGFALGGIEGTFSRNDEGDILFCPAQTLTDNIGSIEKGRCIEVL